MSFLLSALASFGFKFAAGHLAKAFFSRSITGATGTLRALVAGLGWRFAAGLLTALYFEDDRVAGAVEGLLGAVSDAVLG